MEGFLRRYTVEGLEFDAGLRISNVLILTSVINFHCVKKKERKPDVSITESIVTIHYKKFNIDN